MTQSYIVLLISVNEHNRQLPEVQKGQFFKTLYKEN